VTSFFCSIKLLLDQAKRSAERHIHEIDLD